MTDIPTTCAEDIFKVNEETLSDDGIYVSGVIGPFYRAVVKLSDKVALLVVAVVNGLHLTEDGYCTGSQNVAHSQQSS